VLDEDSLASVPDDDSVAFVGSVLLDDSVPLVGSPEELESGSIVVIVGSIVSLLDDDGSESVVLSVTPDIVVSGSEFDPSLLLESLLLSSFPSLVSSEQPAKNNEAQRAGRTATSLNLFMMINL
jgi:hypothetical protein